MFEFAEILLLIQKNVKGETSSSINFYADPNHQKLVTKSRKRINMGAGKMDDMKVLGRWNFYHQ